MSLAPTAWLPARTSPRAGTLRLICFPSAGSGASRYRGWPAALPHDVDVLAVQLPGREGRFGEAPFDQLEPLISVLVRELAPVVGDGTPYVLFGHSMGALIAFELARRLRRDVLRGPRQLQVSGHRAPQLPHLGPRLHAEPDARLAHEMRRLGGTRQEILRADELVHLLLPTLRADWTLWETYAYQPEPPLDCDIAVFGGAEDTETSYFELAAWRDQTTRTCSLRLFPGDHFFLDSARNLFLSALAEAVQPYRPKEDAEA